MALNIPKCIRAGDSLKFVDVASNYPAPAWSITYTIADAERAFDFESTADGSKHSFALLPAETAKFVAGEYVFQATISDGTDRFTLGTGRVRVDADLKLNARANLSHVEKTIANLEAVIEGKATNDQLSFTIAGRSLGRYPVADLLAWRDKYKGELRNLKRAEEVSQGRRNSAHIRVSF